MGQILRAIFILVILAAIGLAGYAYFGDMKPLPQDQSIPVELNAVN
ncbi:hypothetical protein [Phaeovulum sp. W22_SRMD_FR3]